MFDSKRCEYSQTMLCETSQHKCPPRQLHQALEMCVRAIAVLACLTINNCDALSVGLGRLEQLPGRVGVGPRACDQWTSQRHYPSALPCHQQRLRHGLSMAGFGGGRAPNPKETPKKMTSGEAVARIAQKEYDQLKKDGGTVARVFARQRGNDDWLPIGYVCTEPGKTSEGLQGQKRLLLEHAVLIYPTLKPAAAAKKIVLEVGYLLQDADEVIVCKARYRGDRVGVALDPRPGPYFKSFGAAGFGKDMSSAATLGERASIVNLVSALYTTCCQVQVTKGSRPCK